MHYSDKREAKVKVCHSLVENGWKVYGFDPDQSDSMTDYYHPASWDGIAEKNGYVLVIDQHSTYYSGYELKKYNYNKQRYVANERIVKLTAMMNDSASTENEKASCAVLIEKEKEKAGIEPEYTTIETYPTFIHGNPKGCSWHIEKDGQIIAKGKGVFSVNEYDWENKEKSAADQKAEKVRAFINKIEKVLSDSDALLTEVIKVPVTKIKPVEKADNTINVNDLLSFSYHGHYWIVTDVYTVGEQVRVVYELLGSEKRGYKRVKNSKRYYQPLSRLQKEMNDGKVKVYTLQEVTEYQEKTIFKKTVRKQSVVDAPAIETSEEIIKEEYTYGNEEKATKKQLWALHCATKLNTTGLKVSKVKASELISKSKNGINITNEVQALLGMVNDNKTEKESVYSAEKVEEITDMIFEISANIRTSNWTHDPVLLQKEDEIHDYKSKLFDGLKVRNIIINEQIITFINSIVSDNLIVEALKEYSESKITNNRTREKPLEKQDDSILIPKIKKQIESTQKKLDALSGNYLTNTWKRQQEENSREMKRNSLRFEISLLEYLKKKAAINSMTKLEQALLVGSFRDRIHSYSVQKAEIFYPEIDSRYDLNGWYNLEVSKKQKRLNKAGINNTQHLRLVVEEYNQIKQMIFKPIDLKTKEIKKLESEVKFKRIEGYFPTPKSIVDQMIDLADIQDGERILEPSAGNGNILDGITEYTQKNSITAEVQGIEWNHSLREILQLKGYDLVGNDFLEYVNYNHYDKILMNPPFEKMRDIDHVQHAYKHLKEGGRLVAIMSPHFTFANDAKSVSFREWLDVRGYYEKLPEGSFKESGTGVNTVIVIIDKFEETAAEAI